MRQMNKVNYQRHPRNIPDTDEGNLRLYYELELLRSSYEEEKLQKQLERYIQIIDTLAERGLLTDFNTDLEIDKATRRTDWYEPLMKPIPSPREGEEQDAFISRCMSAIGGEYDDKKQAVAICHTSWREHKKSKIPQQPEITDPVEKKPEIHIHLDDDEARVIDLEYKRERLQLIKALKEKVRG